VLVAISIVGALAIPFGDPQFLDRAIALELSFITLAIVIFLDSGVLLRKYRSVNLHYLPAFHLRSL
jgi:hypothetical protein